MDQLHLQLYAKSKTRDFGEQLSAFKTVTIGAEPTTVELALSAPPGEELTEVRIDPDDKPSSFVLHDLKVRSAGGRELYAWDGNPASLGKLVELRATRTHDGVVLESFSNDPFLLIPLGETEPTGVALEMTVSGEVAVPRGAEELADVVRSLRSSLRLSIDDLADQQEGLQDAIVVHQAHSRSETAALKAQLSDLLDRIQAAEEDVAAAADTGRAEVSARVDELLTTIAKNREEIFSEVRDDWRSVSRQISETAEAASRQSRSHSSELLSNVLTEIAVLTQAVHRLAGAKNAMEEIRRELEIPQDELAVPALRQLKAEANESRAQLKSLQSSMSWRLTRPFRSLVSAFKDPHKP